MPEWVRFDGARFDGLGRYRIDITADTTTLGTHKSEMRFQTDVGELKIPLSISVIKSPTPSKKVLWTSTPFGKFSSSTAPIDELIREHFELSTLHLYRDTAHLRHRQLEYLKERISQ